MIAEILKPNKLALFSSTLLSLRFSFRGDPSKSPRTVARLSFFVAAEVHFKRDSGSKGDEPEKGRTDGDILSVFDEAVVEIDRRRGDTGATVVVRNGDILKFEIPLDWESDANTAA
ncbi:hypothetical protein [Rhizobium sp. RCC_161_2]|uniref:hypothetical protein n=1 Tax=Rhizobium sp. RCC_161_2 TaxID=3239219 RepID=UPI003525F5E8